MLRRTTVSLLVLVAAALSVVLVGCGASASSDGVDPAAAAPRDALFYAEVTLRPTGDVRQGALDAAAKLLHADDPAARIRTLLQQAFAKADPPVDYRRDIDPWLGDRAGLWVGEPASAGAEPLVGASIAVRDAELAQKKIEELQARDGQKPVKRSANGEDYEVYPDDDVAVAFRDEDMLVGTEPSVKRMLALGDDGGLSRSDAYTRALEPLERKRLGTLYLDTNRLFDLARRMNPGAAQSFGALQPLVAAGALKPVAASLQADGDRLLVEGATAAPRDAARQLGAFGGGAARLLDDLPASSWGAYAIPQAGRSLRIAFRQAAGAFGGAAVVERLRAQLGLDLERDVFSWMGDLGLFVRGTRVSAVDGAVVFGVTDERRAASAFGKFVGLARTRGGLDPKPLRVRGADSAFDLGVEDTPKPVVLARSHDRMVLAFGTEAAAQGLAPDRPLKDGEGYADARDALGGDMDPAMFVLMPAIVSLVDSAGNPSLDWARARPYLDALGAIAIGAKQDGDVLRMRFAAGLG